MEKVPSRNRAEISESAQRLGTQQGELLAMAPSRQLNLVLRLRQRVAGFLASKPDLRQETLTRIAIEDDSAVLSADFPIEPASES